MVISAKHTYLQDEGAQLILITGHFPLYDSVMYDGNPPSGTLVKAHEWKKFFEFEGKYSYWDIMKNGSVTGLSSAPLSYWLMRQWYSVTGINHYSGPGLSMIWVCLTCIVLFLFARNILEDKPDALAVLFIWSVSPTLIVVPAQARMYDLIALCSVFLGMARSKYFAKNISHHNIQMVC